MAADQLLLSEAEQGHGGHRVYEWDGPWVSLGRFQRAERALVPGWSMFCGRPTGGRAVLHGHDITFALALPHHGDGRRLKDVYRRLTSPLIEALNACGLPCVLAEQTSYSGQGKVSEECFAFRSANDIVCPQNGHKVCGCALRISDSAALLQASIPCRPPLVNPDSVIVGATSAEVREWGDRRFEEAINHFVSSR